MTAAASAVTQISPITRATDAPQVALSAYEQLLDLLNTLDIDQWHASTDCPGWSVADMVGHLIGSAKANASLRENMRQQAWGARHRKDHSGNAMDAANALQVSDHRSLDPAERVTMLASLAPRAVAGRMRFPRPLRQASIPIAQSGSSAGMPPRLQLGHLVDVVYTRDVWMHTLDVARATSREVDLSAPVNARIVADVVREWALLHRHPVDLTLTGPCGGRFVSGTGGERLELDAVTFCRTISGRGSGQGLLRHLVVF
ncbi:maleylpyruvate isomerase family mycothiol-dependent enzyme [Terrabacter sp. NPDC080008]|uniref:maleylpyruvate isomerase family mycothiol-dependent enzyme n=1 Tax=Terrabacter sp. NPDC080008 TaxID=3155176 RepID=UPI00344C70EF